MPCSFAIKKSIIKVQFSSIDSDKDESVEHVTCDSWIEIEGKEKKHNDQIKIPFN